MVDERIRVEQNSQKWGMTYQDGHFHHCKSLNTFKHGAKRSQLPQNCVCFDTIPNVLQVFSIRIVFVLHI